MGRKLQKVEGSLLWRFGGKEMKKIKVSLVKSIIGQRHHSRATVRALGLRKKIGTSVVHDANPAILGMVKAVSHLVRVEELD